MGSGNRDGAARDAQPPPGGKTAGSGDALGQVRAPLVIYLLGPPGAGKSLVGRTLEQIAVADGWSVNRRGDLPIIGAMIKAEDEWIGDPLASRRERRRRSHARRFRRTTLGSFDILDLNVLSDAFAIVQAAMYDDVHVASEGRRLFVVELARIDRRASLPGGITNESVIRDIAFGPLAMQSSILFVDAPLDDRMARVTSRFAPGVENRHYISDFVFRTHYFDGFKHDLSAVGTDGADTLSTVPHLKRRLDAAYRGFMVRPHIDYFANHTGALDEVAKRVGRFWAATKERARWAEVLASDPERVLRVQRERVNTDMSGPIPGRAQPCAERVIDP